MGPPGPVGPGGPVTVPGVTPAPPPAPDDGNDKGSPDTSSVRSNFPETWIWTDVMTGCVIPILVVWLGGWCTTKSVDALQTFYVLVFCLIRSWFECWFVWHYSWTV